MTTYYNGKIGIISNSLRHGIGKSDLAAGIDSLGLHMVSDEKIVFIRDQIDVSPSPFLRPHSSGQVI